MSVREVKLFDPGRHPPNWMGHIQEGEYALFFKDAHSGEERTVAGDPPAVSTCLIADSLEEALDLAQARVGASPSLRCDVYDSQGKANLPVASIVHQDHRGQENTEALGWKRIRWGIVLIPIGAPMILYDWHRDWALIWPAFFGIQIVAAGVRMLVWGLGTLENSRRTAGRSRLRPTAIAKSSPTPAPARGSGSGGSAT